MTLPIVERLRGYYTMDAGKPMFDSSKRVHRAADLHEAANAIEGIVDELIAAARLEALHAEIERLRGPKT
jgi:hypothetical protein